MFSRPLCRHPVETNRVSLGPPFFAQPDRRSGRGPPSIFQRTAGQPRFGRSSTKCTGSSRASWILRSPSCNPSLFRRRSGKARRDPVVIVQSNDFNESRIQTVIVAAVTSQKIGRQHLSVADLHQNTDRGTHRSPRRRLASATRRWPATRAGALTNQYCLVYDARQVQ